MYTQRRPWTSVLWISLLAFAGCKHADTTGSGVKDAAATSSDPQPLPLTDSTNLIRIPMIDQSADYTCGVASTLAILRYYGESSFEMDMAQIMGSDPDTGTLYTNMSKYIQSKGYQVRTVEENMTLDQLKQNLDAKIPTIVLIEAWADNPVKSWSQTWAHGHYVVAVGYDDNVVYFMDPVNPGQYSYIPQAEFVTRWHGYSDAQAKAQAFGMGIVGRGSFDIDLVPTSDLASAAAAGVKQERLNGIIRVPYSRQGSATSGGAAALQSVMYYYGEDQLDFKLQILKGLAPGSQGITFQSMAAYATSKGYTATVQPSVKLSDLQASLAAGAPQIVLLATSDPTVYDWTDGTNKGRYVIAIGATSDRVYIMDPARGGYAYVPNTDFRKLWLGGDASANAANGTVLSVNKGTPSFDPTQIAPIE